MQTHFYDQYLPWLLNDVWFANGSVVFTRHGLVMVTFNGFRREVTITLVKIKRKVNSKWAFCAVFVNTEKLHCVMLKHTAQTHGATNMFKIAGNL